MTEEELAEAAAEAVARIGRRLGAEVVPEGTEPAQLLAPAAALRVARQVELAAGRQVGVHIRRAARMACPGMRSAGCWVSARSRLMPTCPSAATRSATPSGRGRRPRGVTRRCSCGPARRAGRGSATAGRSSCPWPTRRATRTAAGAWPLSRPSGRRAADGAWRLAHAVTVYSLQELALASTDGRW
jgi:hypothetical protein